MRKQTEKGKITALYERLSHDDGRSDESVSVENQESICQGGFHQMELPNEPEFTIVPFTTF